MNLFFFLLLHLLCCHSPFQALTTFAMPRHPAGIASGLFSFSGVGLLAPRPTPNMEDQVEFIFPRAAWSSWVARIPRDRHFPYTFTWATERN
jgi:hypothetical protein